MKIKLVSESAKNAVQAASDEVAKKLLALDKKNEKLRKELKNLPLKSSKTIQGVLKKAIADNEKTKKSVADDLFFENLEKQVDLKEKEFEKISVPALETIQKMILKSPQPNSTVFLALSKLAADFELERGKARKKQEKIKSANSNVSDDILEKIVWLEEMEDVAKFFQKMQSSVLKAIAATKSKDNIKVSNDYPKRRERSKLAPLCVSSSNSEFSGAFNFLGRGDQIMEMASMFVSDAKNHYNLGVEILGGSPKKIEDARSMDTASRDGINDSVWEFVSETIYDKDIFGPKALKEHREKVQREEAAKAKAELKKAIGDVGHKVSRKRKM